MNKFRILVLHDGKPGHQTQSVGMAKLIQKNWAAECEVTLLRAKPRFKLLNKIIRKLVTKKSGWIRRFFFNCYVMEGLPERAPNLIISFGGDVVALNLSLRQLWKVPNIVNGKLYGLPNALVAAHVTAFGDDSLPSNSVATRIALCKTDKAVCEAEGAAIKTQAGNQRLWALFVGGDGGGYEYSQEDWIALGNALEKLSVQHGIRWLVSTSRRTSNAGQQLLKEACSESFCQSAIWYGDDSSTSLNAYLGAAEKLFCTEDSMSMLSESVAMGKPVISVSPACANPTPTHAKMVGHMENVGLINRLPISSMAHYRGENVVPVESYDSHLDSIFHRLIDLGVIAPPMRGGVAGGISSPVLANA
ncbi:mitochondrial fission ELM1 family protein [Spongiibacter sp. KMU-158]|uniref:Mitochondrial fission ELM1 family protein n=1 Tax=Spongiibacter pelagi TaxID=2760804 RepID=A0A927C4V4_9GAMM|nr:ELM1/GtrOC1 family putative glycosyltransferase [Spongiibacter pelagi]MBD2859465.1 mitochondrial fission ELM1 family protein [Spongiibacter pelagi]